MLLIRLTLRVPTPRGRPRHPAGVLRGGGRGAAGRRPRGGHAPAPAAPLTPRASSPPSDTLRKYPIAPHQHCDSVGPFTGRAFPGTPGCLGAGRRPPLFSPKIGRIPNLQMSFFWIGGDWRGGKVKEVRARPAQPVQPPAYVLGPWREDKENVRQEASARQRANEAGAAWGYGSGTGRPPPPRTLPPAAPWVPRPSTSCGPWWPPASAPRPPDPPPLAYRPPHPSSHPPIRSSRFSPRTSTKPL